MRRRGALLAGEEFPEFGQALAGDLGDGQNRRMSEAGRRKERPDPRFDRHAAVGVGEVGLGHGDRPTGQAEKVGMWRGAQ